MSEINYFAFGLHGPSGGRQEREVPRVAVQENGLQQRPRDLNNQSILPPLSIKVQYDEVSKTPYVTDNQAYNITKTCNVNSSLLQKSLNVRPCVVVLKRSLVVEDALRKTQQSTTQDRLIKISKDKHKVQRLRHRNKYTRPSPNFKCHQCGRSFPGRTPYIQHLRSCSFAPPGACPLCSKILSSPQKLRDHLRFVHGKSEEQVFLPCSLCGKKCRNRASLEKHLIVRHSPLNSFAVVSPFMCDVCKQEFPNKQELKQHMFKYHIQKNLETTSESRSGVFPECQDDIATIVQKVIEPSGPPVVAYSCPHCFTLHANKDRFKKHLGFILPTSFHLHEVSVDPEVLARQKKPVNCEVCGTRAANLAFLHTHQSGHSEISRPYVCPKDKCGRQFLFRCQLDRHALIHQVGAPMKILVEPQTPIQKVLLGRYKCTVCKKQTRCQERLSAHIASCHRGKFEFRCKICNICFTNSKSLERHCHRKQHNGQEITEVAEPWIEPEAPPSQLVSTVNPPIQTVRPDSLGSSDSVSTSDAFSMYFQSLSSLDMALDFEGNPTSFDTEVCNENDSNRNNNFSFCGPPQLLHGRPAVTEVTELSNHDPEMGQELQFHTLQTVPLEPLADLDTSYLQSIQVQPLSQVQNSLNVPIIEPVELSNTKLPIIFEKPAPVKSNTFQNLPRKKQVKVEAYQDTSRVKSEEAPSHLKTLETTPVNNAPNKIPVDSGLLNSTEVHQSMTTQKNLTLGVLAEVKSEVEKLKELPVSFTSSKTSTTVICSKYSSKPLLSKEDKLQVCLNIIPPVDMKKESTPNIADLLVQTHVDLIIDAVARNENFPDENENNMHDSVGSEATPSHDNIPCDNSCEIPSNMTNSLAVSESCDSSSLSDMTVSFAPEIKHKSKHRVSNCADCGKVFSSSHSAARHAKLSCPGRQYSKLEINCPKCNFLLPNRKELLKHQREAHPETMFTCAACSKSFLLAQSLARHQKESCNFREAFYCRMCKLSFATTDDIRNHNAEKHSSYSACGICGKNLSTPQSLKRHMKCHKTSNDNVSSVSEVEENLPQTQPLAYYKPSSPLSTLPLSVSNGETSFLNKQVYDQELKQASNKNCKRSMEEFKHTDFENTAQIGKPEERNKIKQKNDEIINVSEHNLVPYQQRLSFQQEEVLNQGFNFKTSSDYSSATFNQDLQSINFNEDIVCDFASTNNQYLNGTMVHGNDSDNLPDEFNLSDMFLIKNGALQCDFCEASFLSDKLLLRHLSTQHFPNTQWQPAQPSQNGTTSAGSSASCTTLTVRDTVHNYF